MQLLIVHLIFKSIQNMKMFKDQLYVYTTEWCEIKNLISQIILLKH
jgi:hypothetical protein